MTTQHPIWNNTNSEDQIPDIELILYPEFTAYENKKPEKDSIILIYYREKNTWKFFTFLKEGKVLLPIENLEELRYQVLKFIRNIANNLSGLASYSEIIGAIGHNRSGIRKYCDLQAIYNNIIKEIEWVEENYPDHQDEEIEDHGLLTYNELLEGISIKYIVVRNKIDKEQTIKALKYLHDRRDIDTDLAAVNGLVHLYQNSDAIVNIIPIAFATGSSFMYNGEEYTLVYVSINEWQWMDKNNEFCLDGAYYSTSSITVKELEAMGKTLRRPD